MIHFGNTIPEPPLSYLRQFMREAMQLVSAYICTVQTFLCIAHKLFLLCLVTGHDHAYFINFLVACLLFCVKFMYHLHTLYINMLWSEGVNFMIIVITTQN